jgi:hypothetical protein
MFQHSTLWTWEETFEFCEIRQISWPGQSLPDSQNINFIESENYFLITTVIVAIIIIIIIIIITRKYIYLIYKAKNMFLCLYLIQNHISQPI